jgi:hypothetical protein
MDIKVNDAEWAALGNDEQQRIEDIVKAFFKDAAIVPDAATPASGVQPQAIAPLANPLCKAACDIAQAAATAACASLVNPIAIAACVAAASAAGDECRRRC